MLEIVVNSTDGPVAVSAPHMSSKALIGRSHVRQRKAVILDPSMEFIELALHGPHGGPAHFTEHAAGLRQNELGLQENDSFLDRLDFRFTRV